MRGQKVVLLVTGLAVLLAGAWASLRPGNTENPATRAPQEAAGAPLVQVRVPDLSPTERQGETRFNDRCASCHGVHAAGQDGVAPPLVHRIYEPSHHADMSFLMAVRQGVRAHHWPFGNMPPIPDLAADDVALIVTYVRALQRENGIR
ncbi:c-type cytochrome [Roseibium aestuarii]|uniref:C-type cytochrome n=1 Tax=Roseibium aestuarii TaxID=2600299 RepID=A0ABW4JXE0_9HYPH|nr:cytochrome c [Roseibium aestuarii]